MPIDPSVLGEHARQVLPLIEQAVITGDFEEQEFERAMYLARKRMERHANTGLSIPSASGRTVIYKGLFTVSHIADFYWDLRDPGFETPFAWQPRLNVNVAAWNVRQMKTKWGSCNSEDGRLLFNLELIKKPVACIEYVVVHELAHLKEPKHNAPFKALMSEHLPNWQERRRILNSTELGPETWEPRLAVV